MSAVRPRVGDPCPPLHGGKLCREALMDEWKGRIGEWLCTQKAGHDGPHVASALVVIGAVWDETAVETFQGVTQ